MPSIPIRIRAIQPTDHGFIYAYWLNSFEPFRDKRIGRDLYYQEHHTAVSRVLAAPQCGLIACDAEDDGLFFGFLVGSYLPVGRVLDYVFVKPVYRRMGVGHALLQTFGVADAYTHHTTFSTHVVGRAVFDPYRFFIRA